MLERLLVDDELFTFILLLVDSWLLFDLLKLLDLLLLTLSVIVLLYWVEIFNDSDSLYWLELLVSLFALSEPFEVLLLPLFSVVLIVEDSELLTPFIIVVDFWSPLDSCLLLFFWLLTSFLLYITLES